MSTVALKGKLEWIETKETVKLNNLECGNDITKISNRNEDDPHAAATRGKGTIATRKVGKWHWKGKWAFGSHIDETFSNKHNIATPVPKNAHKLQPFHYYFEEVADPATVAVPSLALPVSLATNPNATEHDNSRINDETSAGGVKSHSALRQRNEPGRELLSPTTSSRDDGANPGSPFTVNHANNDATPPLTGGPVLGESEDKAQNQDREPSSSSSTLKTNVETVKTSNVRGAITKEKGVIPGSRALSVEETAVPQRISQNATRDHTGTKVDATINTELETCTNEQRKESRRHDDSGQIPLEKRTVAGDVNKKAQTDSQALDAPIAKVDENDETTSQVPDTPYSAIPKQLDPSLSFAAVSSADPPFTEALLFFRQKNDCNPNPRTPGVPGKSASSDDQNPCPPGGLWKGYFQNATVGRGKGTQRIHEEFYLFLNACPGENTLFAFDVVQNQMPPTHVADPVLVRGRGENQFGTFEICGYLDITTMEMEIQRQYVHVEEEITARNPSPNKKKKQRLSTTVVTRHKSSRPYFTRKRQPSWKVKSQEENVEDEPYKRKRRKLNVEIAYGNSEGHANVGTTPSSMASTGSKGSGPDSTLLSTSSSSSNLGTNRTPVKRKSPNPVGSGSRKRGSSACTFKASPKQSNLAVTSNAATMKLPPTGDAQKSKWRAAHFLYYQRHDPEEQHSQHQQQQHNQQQQISKLTKQRSSSGAASTSTISTNPKYVIYEGEMVDSKREGRGICLYSNNMLYEGEWKRNKEHGYGKVMTSDRTRIIYEGEFERGRMQGRGTYYFEQAEDSKCTKAGARYIGEFKENMRHGIGKYYLPDKSVYDGMWSNGLMNGRGVFTWPDNSFYDGEWKDGKRTGQGILKTSDGFYYDGMWVNNAMEGRGFAVYPNGQKYEGLFSKGRREGRGTLTLTNGVVYEGRFRDDAVDGQGTMKMSRATVVPTKDGKDDFMIPISFQSDMSHIHTKAGFTSVGD